VAAFQAYNVTRSVEVASDVEMAETPWARMKGLLGRTAADFPAGRGLWISFTQGIHTIGMKFPIDAAYLDSDSRVIRLYHRLVPFRIACILLRAKSVLELPAGTLEQSGTELGDILEIREKPF
jgi:uncharacterized protein